VNVYTWRVDEERLPSGASGRITAQGSHESGAVCVALTSWLISTRSSARHVAAQDARSTRTSDLETYLTPNNIGAMLDVPLREEGKTVGVLCAEHVGGAREWTVDEQNFAISVANLIVVAVADEERRNALTRLA
jgi:two-component system sensor histidine kinase/response regulator